MYLRYDRHLFYGILKLVKITEIAADIHQDVFLKLWTYRAQIDPDKPLIAFLKQIAKNMAIDFYRKAARDNKLQRQLAATMTELHDPVNEHMVLKDISQALEDAIQKLPPQRQQVFRLVKLDHKTYEYAAAHFGVSVGTIKDHMAKASKFLRTEITAGDIQPYLVLLLLLDTVRNS